jgi:hypothetical protein
VKASSPRKRSLKSPATAKAAPPAEIRELDIRLPPSNKLPLECGVLMHLTAAAAVPAVGAPPSTSTAGPSRGGGGGGGRTIKSPSACAARAGTEGGAKRSRNGAASTAATTSTGSALELDGATGAVGRLEVDAQGGQLPRRGASLLSVCFSAGVESSTWHHTLSSRLHLRARLPIRASILSIIELVYRLLHACLHLAKSCWI